MNAEASCDSLTQEMPGAAGRYLQRSPIMSTMQLYNDHGEVTLSDDEWDAITEAATEHGWEPVDLPDDGHALSDDDALHLAEALHAALATGEVMPHQLLPDDPDAEERLELFMEICESGALLEK